MDRETLELRQAELRIRHSEPNLAELLDQAAGRKMRKRQALQKISDFWNQVRADVDLIERKRANKKQTQAKRQQSSVLEQSPLEFRLLPDSPSERQGA